MKARTSVRGTKRRNQRLPDYLRTPSLPFFLWLRALTGQKLALAHRQHVGVQARAAGREVSLYRGALRVAAEGNRAQAP